MRSRRSILVLLVGVLAITGLTGWGNRPKAKTPAPKKQMSQAQPAATPAAQATPTMASATEQSRQAQSGTTTAAAPTTKEHSGQQQANAASSN